MSNAAQQCGGDVTTTYRHPVPGGMMGAASKEDSRRGLLLSGLLHLGLGLVAWILISSRVNLSESSVARLYDIEFVPLSSLETVLPKGAPPQKVSAPDVEHPTNPHPQVNSYSPPRVPATRNAAKVQEMAKPVTTTSSASSAPVGVPNGDSSTLEKARVNYQDMIASMLARAKRYPERALRRRMTGEGTVRIEIASDGSIAEFNIVESTDSPILDEELKAMVDRAAPFPAFPPDLRRQSLALVVPITFRLDG